MTNNNNATNNNSNMKGGVNMANYEDMNSEELLKISDSRTSEINSVKSEMEEMEEKINKLMAMMEKSNSEKVNEVIEEDPTMYDNVEYVEESIQEENIKEELAMNNKIECPFQVGECLEIKSTKEHVTVVNISEDTFTVIYKGKTVVRQINKETLDKFSKVSLAVKDVEVEKENTPEEKEVPVQELNIDNDPRIIAALEAAKKEIEQANIQAVKEIEAAKKLAEQQIQAARQAAEKEISEVKEKAIKDIKEDTTDIEAMIQARLQTIESSKSIEVEMIKEKAIKEIQDIEVNTKKEMEVIIKNKEIEINKVSKPVAINGLDILSQCIIEHFTDADFQEYLSFGSTADLAETVCESVSARIHQLEVEGKKVDKVTLYELLQSKKFFCNLEECFSRLQKIATERSITIKDIDMSLIYKAFGRPSTTPEYNVAEGFYNKYKY